MAAGFIYILSNPYLVGVSGMTLLKIGGTTRSAQARALELSAATGVPGSFSVVYEVATPDWQRLETAVHRSLRVHRRAGEFFEIRPDEAITVIEKLLQQQAPPAKSHNLNGGNSPSFRYAAMVRFVPAPSGFDLHVEGVAIGRLITSEQALRYELLSEISGDYILEVELVSRSRQADLSGVIIEDAKCRAAWLAFILKRFTTPVFGDPDGAGNRLVSVNGLAIARLMQRRQGRGFLIRRETAVYDLEPVPCPRSPRLAERFGAVVTITPADAPPHPERVFVSFAQLGLETSVRHYLMDQTCAEAVFTRTRWSCHLALFNCEISISLHR